MYKNINSLKESDVYSLSLFSLYKLIDAKEYSVLGELPYILDRKNLLDLCTYFGGRTITIPTVSELYSVLNLLVLYQYVNIEGIEWDVAISKLGYSSDEVDNVKKGYRVVSEVLDMYNFNRS